MVSHQYDVELGQTITGEFELDDDGEPFWFNLESNPVYGGVVEIFGGRRRKFSYTAPTNFVGTDVISVSAVDDRGVSGPISNIIFNVTGVLSSDDKPRIVDKFALHQNYPNPFNPLTTLRYDIPDDGFVNIAIYDLKGKMVKKLVNSFRSAGDQSVQWNATNTQGEPVSAGIYLYEIQSREFRQTKKMVLLK